MTTLAVDTPRTIVTGDFNSIGCVGTDIVYEGAMVGDNGAGYGRPLVAGDLFRGHSLLQVDNHTGSAGVKEVRLRTGRYRISSTISGVLITDVGKEVFASDDDTLTLSAVGNSRVGVVIRYVTTNTAIVEFNTNDPTIVTQDQLFGSFMAGQASLQGILDAPRATQNCKIASRRVSWDGKVYRYSSAVADCSNELLAYSAHYRQAFNWSAVVSGALDSTTMVVTVGGTDGDGGGNIAANYLAGGEILITSTAGLGSFCLGIVSNTEVSGGGPMTIVVDKPLPLLLTTNYKVEGMGCRYAELTAIVNCPADAPMVGRPTVMATALLPYHWEQTWGMCWITPNNGFSTVDVGNSNFNQQVVVWNGTIGPHDKDKAHGEYSQHIGFVHSRTQAGTTQGAPFIMLQLDK